MSRDAVMLLLYLEDRGLKLEVVGGSLRVSPKGRLTEWESEQVRAMLTELIEVVKADGREKQGRVTG